MPAQPTPAKQQLYVQLVDVLNTLFGSHPGFRAAHAKGVVCEGSFTAAPAAAGISRAAHFQGASVAVTCRFSNATGIPTIPDGDPNATPKGFAIRFHAPGAGDTDIVAHSANGFPVSTAEDFLIFLRAVAASGPGVEHPTPVEQFVGAHPNTKKFVQLPKPTPASFATTGYFGVNAFRFVDKDGRVQPGRYVIQPVAGEKFLDAADAAARKPDFLFEELKQRLGQSPLQFRLKLQLPNAGDPTHDPSHVWPADRTLVELGTLSINSVVADSDSAQKKLIFDPARLIDGIAFSDDPLPADRAGVYSVSFSRRNP